MIQGTQTQDEVIIPKTSRRYRPWIAGAVIVSAMTFFAWPSLSAWSSSAIRVERDSLVVAKVERGTLIRDVAVSGKIVAANAPQLYSAEAGKVTLLIKPGEAVEKNQVVATVESPELDALIKQQESTLMQLTIDNRRAELADQEAQLNLEREMNAALASLNVAKREYQRADISFKQNIVSEVDWLTKQDELSASELFYQHAQKRVEFAKERLSFESQNRQFLVEKQQLILDELVRRQDALAIKAPVTGVVGNWLIAQKNQVAANMAVMTVVDLSEYEAELVVPEFYADELVIGLPVSMKVAGQALTATIAAISPEIKNNQLQVRALIQKDETVSLRQNQRLSGRIEFEKKSNALKIKRGPFVGSNEGAYVYRLNKELNADKVAIATGINSVEYIEVLSGVEEGDEVIISDYKDFTAAEQLNIVN